MNASNVRNPPTSHDCGCCRAELRTQPPVGDGSRVIFRLPGELCQHCKAAGCEWNMAHCIRTDRVVSEAAESYARKLRAQPWGGGGGPDVGCPGTHTICDRCGEHVPNDVWENHLVKHLRGELATLSVEEVMVRAAAHRGGWHDAFGELGAEAERSRALREDLKLPKERERVLTFGYDGDGYPVATTPAAADRAQLASLHRARRTIVLEIDCLQADQEHDRARALQRALDAIDHVFRMMALQGEGWR